MDFPYIVEPRRDTGLYNAKLGIWLFLASEVMLFGALFSAYVLLRVGALPGMWPHGWLNVPIGTANTIVLITSSITTVMAWVSCKERQYKRFKFFHALTILLAMTFVCIKSFEYHDKFTHYEITLANGKFADGHLLARSKDFDLAKQTGSVTIHGYEVDRRDGFDGHAPARGQEHPARGDHHPGDRNQDAWNATARGITPIWPSTSRSRPCTRFT